MGRYAVVCGVDAMSDSTFAATIFIVYMLLAATCGAVFAMSGTHECSVMVSDATGNKAEYVTECRL